MPAESIWFDGHFPGEPILPGVAQLAVIVDILEEALAQPVRVTHVSRVRFKQAIRPADTVFVTIQPRGEDLLTYVFRMSNGSEALCSGQVKIAHAVSPGDGARGTTRAQEPELKKEKER